MLQWPNAALWPLIPLTLLGLLGGERQPTCTSPYGPVGCRHIRKSILPVRFLNSALVSQLE